MAPVTTGTLISTGARRPDVYVLELGGQDDAFARSEAASACSAVEPLGTGLATARGVTARARGLAFTRRVATLLGRTAPRIEDAVACLDAAALDRPAGFGSDPTEDDRAADTDGHTATATATSHAPIPDPGDSIRVRATDVRGLTGVDTRRAERELGGVLVDRGFEVDLEAPDHELRALFAAPPGHDDEDDGTVTIGLADEREVETVDGADEPPGAADSTVDPDATDSTVDPDATDSPADLDSFGDDDPGVCALGWLAAESVRDFGDRKPTDKPFFQPGSMDPLEARALANLAGARPGRTLLDPMCGTGGLLAEAALVGADVVGTDAQWKMVRGARENLRHYLGLTDATRDSDDAGDGDANPATAAPSTGTADGLPSPGDAAVTRADARRLPVRDGAVDAVVFDAPYGRQSWHSDDLAAVVGDALAEARRVASRAVVVGDRPWADAAREAGWTVAERFERRVHRSLVRHVLVLRADAPPE